MNSSRTSNAIRLKDLVNQSLLSMRWRAGGLAAFLASIASFIEFPARTIPGNLILSNVAIIIDFMASVYSVLTATLNVLPLTVRSCNVAAPWRLPMSAWLVAGSVIVAVAPIFACKPNGPGAKRL